MIHFTVDGAPRAAIKFAGFATIKPTTCGSKTMTTRGHVDAAWIHNAHRCAIYSALPYR